MKGKEYQLVLLLIFIGAKGNLIALADITLVLALLWTTYLIRASKTKIPVGFYYFTALYIVLTLCYFFKFGWVNIWSSSRLFIKITYGVFTLLLVRDKIFYYYERIIVLFSAISLPLFLLQIVAFPYLKWFVGLIENNIPALNYRENWYVNNFIFTLNENALLRNSGMAWEPKGFANMVLIAIVFNLLRTKFVLDKRFYILVITLLTTFSTTGIFILVFLVPFIFVNNYRASYRPLLVIVFAFVGLGVYSSGVVSDKITREIDEREKHLVYLDAETNQQSITLGRFGSFVLAFRDLPKNPLIGIGMQDSERTDGTNTHLVYVSGLADFLSRFGIIGILFLVITYYWSSKAMFEKFKVEGAVIMTFIFMSIFFASAIIISPLFFCFQFYYLIENKNLPSQQRRQV